MDLLIVPTLSLKKRGGVPDWIGFYGIGATIRIGRESWCLPYAGLLVPPQRFVCFIFLLVPDFTKHHIKLLVFVHAVILLINKTLVPKLRLESHVEIVTCSKFMCPIN